ncbi:adhesin [Methanobrevibacter sp. OttesenSCG-928-I08]|nr:adhesin [Methanobrevibacter sp. OttesenSCG-928-I08]
MLNSIKNFIEETSDLQIIVDNDAPGPGEGTRAILSNTDVSVALAAACAGNFLELAKYSAASDKQIIYVNIGDFDIDTEESLRRAWDDNYSNETFAGIRNPGKFLNDAGVFTIQPLKEYPEAGSNRGFISSSNDDVNKYIAEEVVNDVNSYNSNSSKSLNTNLINYHKIKPSVMAIGSSELVKDTNGEFESNYNSFTAPQLLYLISTYLGSDGIDTPSSYESPDSPLKYSLFAKNYYSIGDYMEMGEIVKEYMDENGKAPNYIIYDGAIISYYDLVYNFGLITENHTESSNMGFEREYAFHKYHENILVDIIPIVLILGILFIIYLGIRKIKG